MNENPGHAGLDALVREFLKTLKVRNLSDTHIKGVAWRLGKFLLYLAGREITEVTAVTREVIATFQIEEYERINRMGRPNSVGHQNQMLSAVKQFTSYLKEYDYIVSDPARDIRYAKTPKSLPRGILSQPRPGRSSTPRTRKASSATGTGPSWKCSTPAASGKTS